MFRPCDPEYATSSMRLAPNWRWRLRLKLCAYPSRKFTSNDDRVEPVGTASGWTPGSGGRPCDRMMSVPNVVVAAVVWRNGWFCAFDDEVPPGVKFQKMPYPPRTTIRPLPLTS